MTVFVLGFVFGVGGVCGGPVGDSFAKVILELFPDVVQFLGHLGVTLGSL